MQKNYLKLQLKRTFIIYPEIFLMTLITIAAIFLVCTVMMVTNLNDEDKRMVSIGVVGNTDDPYISVGIETIKNYDSSQFYLEVEEFDEEEAREALKNREISGYIYIPDGYIRSIFRGNNIPAKYITLNTPEGFGTIISKEVSQMASYVVTESQAGMYSMQSVSDDFGCADKGKNVDKLMLAYVNIILSRSELYDVQELGIYDSLSTGGYYICGMLLLFMLLWGISCSKLFSSRKLSLSAVLRAVGISTERQLLCEYIPFLIVTVVTLLLLAIPVGGLISANDFGIRELSGEGIAGSMIFIIKLIPVIMMITMMQTALYELIPGNVGSVLAQFLLTIGMGYLSGCFYPNYFFPDIVQKVAHFLPTGIGFAYIRETMLSELSLVTFFMTALYIILFALITIYARKRRIEGDAR